MQVINRALYILECLQQSETGMGVSAIANTIGVNVSTAHNILKAMRLRGYVGQTPDSRYILGPRLVALAAKAYTSSALLRAAAEPVESLHQWSQETVFLGVLHQASLLYIMELQGIHPLVVRSPKNERTKIHCTAMGKSLLAYVEPGEVDGLLAEAGMPAVTPNTITDVDELKEQLVEVRRRGYALNLAEDALGVHGVAAPIRDHLGRVVAGICVGYPAQYWQESQVGELIEHVVQSGTEISRRLGYVGAIRDGE